MECFPQDEKYSESAICTTLSADVETTLKVSNDGKIKEQIFLLFRK